MKPAVFLDRDGVINKAVVRAGKPYPPASVKELEILPGVAKALEDLRAAGFALVVVTNQPDVARGRQSRAAVEAMHDHLLSTLALDEVRVCYHDDNDNCDCRKPRSGMLTARPRYDLARSVMIGDRWRDIEAGRRAHVGAAILVDYQYDEPVAVDPDVRVGSLADAVQWILSKR